MNTLKPTARMTGLLYLGLGITGMLGFLLIRPVLHEPANGAATLASLSNQQGLARLGIALEYGIVLFQALVAVWFFKLFRSANPVAAGATATFGMVNAVAIVISAACMSVALQVALDPALAPGGDAAGTVQFLYALSKAAWAGGSIFFGLWLIPMGYAVIVSSLMPKLLGQTLIVGGIGYVLSAFGGVLLPPELEAYAEFLAIPATVGEFWMIGYLLWFGVREGASRNVAAASSALVVEGN